MAMPHCASVRVRYGAHAHLGSFVPGPHVDGRSPSNSVAVAANAGAKMTMEDMLATQTRIEPQEKAHCVSCSFDANAANIFQAYVHGTLQFAVERVGFMFGTVDEGAVKVEFIYEPPQEATATSTMLMRDAQEEKAVGFIAAQLGCAKVTFTPRRRSVLSSYRSVWLRVCECPRQVPQPEPTPAHSSPRTRLQQR